MFELYYLYQRPGMLLWLILVIATWSLIWKGIALWKSARRKQKVWFVVLLILNTGGILPIIYLLFHFDGKEKNGHKPVKKEDKIVIKKSGTTKVPDKKISKKPIKKKVIAKKSTKKPVKKKKVTKKKVGKKK
jgi:hypothetical protein